MRSDEYLLLMNQCGSMPGNPMPLTVSERIRLREAGIQTAIEYSEWGKTEPAQGVYDFSLIESILSMNREAEMKTIFAAPMEFVPYWLPDEWKFKYQDGRYNSSISLWNKEATQYKNEYISMLIDMYHASDVMFIYAENDTGESTMLSYAWYDDYAVENFRSIYGCDIPIDFNNEQTKEWLTNSGLAHILETQKLFYPQFKELWNANQWLIGKINPASMNALIPEVMQSFRDTFDPLSLVFLQYTYFDAAHPPENVIYVDMIKEKFNCDVIVEALFCKGLPTTAPKAIAKGFRGQIICPIHNATGEKTVQDWMVEAISNAHKLWENNENNSNVQVA